MEPLPNVQKFPRIVAISTALALVFGCQTGSIGRKVASESTLDPRVEALLKEDAIAAFGLTAHAVLLNKKLARVRHSETWARRQPVKPFKDGGIPTSTFALSAVLVGGLVNISIRDGKDSLPLVGFMKRVFGNRGSVVRSLPVVGIPILSAGVFLSAQGFSLDVPETLKKNEEGQADFMSMPRLHFMFRQDEVAQFEQDRADTQNVATQAAFVAGLKASADDLSKRAAQLYHLEPIDESKLNLRLQAKMLEQFQAKKKWGADDAIGVSIYSILGVLVADAEERIANVEKLVLATHSEDYREVATLDAAIKWYDEVIAAIKKTELEVAARFEEATQSENPKQVALASEFATLGRQLESLRVKISLHRKTISPR